MLRNRFYESALIAPQKMIHASRSAAGWAMITRTDRPDFSVIYCSLMLVIARSGKWPKSHRRGESCKWPQGDANDTTHSTSQSSSNRIPDAKCIWFGLIPNQGHFQLQSCCNTIFVLESSGFFLSPLFAPRARIGRVAVDCLRLRLG